MVVYVMNRGPSPKGDEDEEPGEGIPSTVEEPEHTEPGLLTPSSSVDQASVPLTTHIDTLPSVAGRGLSGNDRSTLFSIPEPLSFEGPGRHDRSFYTTPPQYTDGFSSLSTPVSAGMISPHDASVFDYPTQNPFPTSTPDMQRSGAASQYDSWTTPTFRQNIFSPVDYGAPTTSQTVAPPSMQYIALAPPAQLHDMSHHSGVSIDSMSQRGLPFRTGSLSHPHALPLSHPA